MADIKAEYLACPIRQVVSRFGDKWSMLVLYMLHTSERQRVGERSSGMTGSFETEQLEGMLELGCYRTSAKTTLTQINIV